MNEQLERKVARAIKLIQAAGADGEVVEVAYSGGKDSDVILELTKMSGIQYRAIYKNTTIDPPKTIAHARAAGVEIMPPKTSFFKLIEKAGFPTRWSRFCCSALKEYKILDRVIIGVRRAESRARRQRYTEPTECRFYGSKKVHAEAFYPLLDWTDEDVEAFIIERGIKLHPLYYRDDGTIDVTRRLGCMCCPLASLKERRRQFKEHPRMVRAYCRAAAKFRETHPNAKTANMYGDEFEYFFRNIFFGTQQEWEEWRFGLFTPPNFKEYLENYFNIEL